MTPLTVIVMFQPKFRQLERQHPQVANPLRAAIRTRLSE
jgi:hypothetical protein